MAGGRRLTRVVRRQTPGNGAKNAAAATKHAAHHGHSGTTGLQRLKELQSTLGNQKMQSILEKKPDPVSDAGMKADLEKEARRQFLQVVERIPSLLGPTSQLLAMQPGTIETSPLLSVAMQGYTETAVLLTQLDVAIEMFERSGHDITEIQTIVAIRAHLSTLMFYLRQIAGGAPLGPMAHQTVMEAMQECTRYQVELAIKQAIPPGEGEEPGTTSEADAQKKLVMAEILRRMYLGPPGQYPSAGSLKSLSR